MIQNSKYEHKAKHSHFFYLFRYYIVKREDKYNYWKNWFKKCIIINYWKNGLTNEKIGKTFDFLIISAFIICIIAKWETT
jgi:hypothetical protein